MTSVHQWSKGLGSGHSGPSPATETGHCLIPDPGLKVTAPLSNDEVSTEHLPVGRRSQRNSHLPDDPFPKRMGTDQSDFG